MQFRSLVAVLALSATACTDLSAVQNFAKESSVISSNTAILNGSDTSFDTLQRYVTVLKAHYPDVHAIPPNFARLAAGGPGTAAFDDPKKLAPVAAQVLQKYMQAIGQLAGDTTIVADSGVSGIAGSLSSLGVTDPKAAASLDAAQKLANLLTQSLVRARLTEIVKSADPDVQNMTSFFGEFARQNAQLYDTARAYALVYWQTVNRGCAVPGKHSHAAGNPACAAIDPLSNYASRQEQAVLKQAIKPADDAADAFAKIGTDHAALVRAQGQFDAQALITQLAADEPALLAAIRDLERF